MNRTVAIPLSLLHTVFGVFAVTAFAVLESLDLGSAGNMSLFGGVFFMPILYFALAKIFKRDVKDVFDIGTVCMLFTLMCARINCIISGCCYGISFLGIEGVRWPTRELELIFYAIMIICLMLRVIRQDSKGLNYPIYMIAYGAFRFVIEWFRHSSSDTAFHISHIWAIVVFCLGLSIFIEMKVRSNKVRSNKKRNRR